MGSKFQQRANELNQRSDRLRIPDELAAKNQRQGTGAGGAALRLEWQFAAFVGDVHTLAAASIRTWRFFSEGRKSFQAGGSAGISGGAMAISG